MAAKFVECSLGLKYRIFNKNGTVSGGPMYYLSNGLGKIGYIKLGKILATLHKKTLGFKNKRKNDFSLKEWHALTKRIKLSKKGALFLKEEINVPDFIIF